MTQEAPPARECYEEADLLEAIERCFDLGWTDGLPVVPPVPNLVERFLSQTSRDPNEVIWTMSQLRRACTVELAAINAAMAGCRPEYFPVVLAALEATIDEGQPGVGGWQSTTGGGPLHIVNGPVRTELGFNCAGNIFGPGFRPNATVGRAIRLIILNVYGIRPHELDQSTQGTSGKYTLCIGENEEESPWEPLHVELGYAPNESLVSAVHVRSCEFVDHRHSAEPHHILSDIALTISRTGTGAHSHMRAVVILGPEHAQALARRGLSKQDVKEYLVEHVGMARAQVRALGRSPVSLTQAPTEEDRPGMFAPTVHHADYEDDGAPDEFLPMIAAADDVLVVVAGAPNAGVSAVGHPLGLARALPGRAMVDAPMSA